MEGSATVRSVFWLGRIEGISYLLLLGIAMPLKYAMGIPEPVKWVGWAHGVLFMGFLGALGLAYLNERWSLMTVVGGFVASLLPLGTFVFEARVRRRMSASGAG